jgi:eukaryotic-like serine/threonine-protein kinase
MTVATGTRIGPYELVAPLGTGGMGEVWKARDTRLNRLVALKILPAGTTNDDRRRRFVLEAQAASALNHPNIVTIHDIVSDPGHEAIAMEYIAGRTLDGLILSKGMILADVLRSAIAIASGVAAAHGAGIVHRDLKPGNVMVTDSGEVKVLDFGLAKLSEAMAPDETTRTAPGHTAEGTIVGTVSYMSPEQAEGRRIDARSDIFSFGALLYEMVTGQRAFRGDTRMSTIAAILRDEPTRIAAQRRDIPHDLEQIIVRCLRKDADRRYQSMTDVRLALEEVREEFESSTRAAPFPPVDRRRIAVWALLGLGILTSAGGAWLIWNRKPAVPAGPTIVTPFTNYRGFERNPAVSPDGKMIAFAWEGEQLVTLDIWVKLLDSSPPLKVTTGPEHKMSPVWSPDSRRIAYTSPPGDVYRQVYEIPALGGQPRRITAGSVTDWSPDGGSLLVIRNRTADAEGGVFLVSVADGSTQRLTTFAKGQIQDSARFSLDGTRVLFTAIESADRSHVMQVALAGGEPQPLQIAGLRQADVRTILPGGRELLVAGQRDGGQFALFRVSIEGGSPSELAFGRGATGIASLGGNVGATISAARLAPTLAFVENVSNINVWRVAAWPGAGRTPERWITSTRTNTSPAVSPDGSRIAVSSTRSGTSQIWVTDASGGNPKSITSFFGPTVGTPRWSPDGSQIALDARVDGNPDIWVVSASGGEPRRLTTESSEDIVPDWSPDGKWIYFSSNRTGRLEVWRMPSIGGTTEQITREGGFNPHLSVDGSFVVYLRARDAGELRRCPAAGGKEESIAPEFKSRNFVVLSDGIYGVDAGVPATPGAASTLPGKARFYRFQSRKWEDLRFATAKPIISNGIDLSPDRKWLYYAQIDERGSDIMLVENFR